jgi:outer membrane protein assembly factor BamB
MPLAGKKVCCFRDRCSQQCLPCPPPPPPPPPLASSAATKWGNVCIAAATTTGAASGAAAVAAGGVVVFDLRTLEVKWQVHLDLTTSSTKFTAHMFSSPTVADLDADGQLEIIVGTSVGFVYVLDTQARHALISLWLKPETSEHVQALYHVEVMA